MSTMVERVARALHEAEDERMSPAFRATWDQCVPKYRELMMANARAAIAAMREPTDAMVHVAVKDALDGEGIHSKRNWPTAMGERYSAMIDAALMPTIVTPEAERA